MNEFFKKYKPTIDSLGIIAEISILFLTYQSIRIASDNAKISSESLKQLVKQYVIDSIKTEIEKKKILPTWKFEVIESAKFSIYIEDSANYLINHVRKFHAKKTGIKSIKRSTWFVSEDSIRNISINPTINYLTDFYKQKLVSDSLILNQNRTSYPLGIRFDYSYKQERYQDYGILFLRFAIVWKEKPYFSLIGIEPSAYYSKLFEGSESQRKMLEALNNNILFSTIYKDE